VVTQARLTQIASHHKDSDLVEPVEEVERLTAELRDCVLNIRMLPIGTTFAKFKRLVRDLSAELGKEVVMVTEGAETELDKNVIDQLGDPMVHLIRNSIDHGIESPEERERAGKPRKGTITLAAQHSGANVVITVTDDGKGLDAEKIRQKGLEKGLLRADMELSEQDIWNTIFVPGLSTAKTVTSVSGRGVGMDVVKSTVDALKGSVFVTSSVKGQGTTITIMLPLTLAIIDGLLVKVGETHFVLPLSQVEECVELTGEDIARFHERRMLPVRDQLVPYVRLRDFFAISGERPAREQMVISRINGDRFGLVLDDVVGEHQTVLKSLGWVYRNATGLSGSTILGNGHVALILDVANVMQCARQEEYAALLN
ncbi:MAG: chemotaxis protein CheA, partial [Pseudomonadota bacterium]